MRPKWIQAAAPPPLRMTSAGPVRIQAAAGADGQPRLRRFEMTAYNGGLMRLDGWDLPVIVELTGLTVPSPTVPILRNHDQARIVGHSDVIRVSAVDIQVSGIISGTGADAQEVTASSDNGFPWQASIGAIPDRQQRLAAGERAIVNGQNIEGPCYIVRTGTLREISFLPNGADGSTSARVAAAAAKPNRGPGMYPTFEEWVTALGFIEADLTDQQRAAMMIQYNAACPAEPDPAADPAADPAMAGATPPAPAAAVVPAPALAAAGATPPAIQASAPTIQATIVAERQARAAETQRLADIRRICAAASNPMMTIGTGPQARQVPIEAHATAEGWDTDRTELQVMREDRARVGSIGIIAHSRDSQASLQAMQGAMILRAGGRLDHPAYLTPRAIAMGLPSWLRAGMNDAQRNRVMEAAHAYADMSAVDLCREAVRMDGGNPGQSRRDVIRAAFSGGSLTNVFTTSVNATLLSSYMEVDDTTVGWVTETDVADFKTQERPRVLIGSGLTKLPRGSTADHASYADTAESYKISRYAEQFVIDEQDMIDDRLSVFSDIPAKFGQAAGWLRPDLVYSIILANPTLAQTARQLFNATDGNLNTTSALTSATMKAAIADMRLFRENGRNLNFSPTHLLVPPSLEFTADELINSSAIIIARGGTTDLTVERGNANTLAGRGITRVSEARLENGVTDPNTGIVYAGSATTWWLVSMMAHTIEVAYLRGSGRAPQVRSGTLDRGQWGAWFDVKMDIGAKALDWRGFHENTA